MNEFPISNMPDWPSFSKIKIKIKMFSIDSTTSAVVWLLEVASTSTSTNLLEVASTQTS